MKIAAEFDPMDVAPATIKKALVEAGVKADNVKLSVMREESTRAVKLPVAAAK
jgi:hypothetical protein